MQHSFKQLTFVFLSLLLGVSHFSKSQTLPSEIFVTSRGQLLISTTNSPLTGMVKGTCYRRDITRNIGLSYFFMNRAEKVDVLGMVVNGYEDGKWQFTDSLGNVIGKCRFKLGIEHGVMRIYYSTGKNKMQTRYKNGVAHGMHKEWDEAGILIVKMRYFKGKVTRVFIDKKMGVISSVGVHDSINNVLMNDSTFCFFHKYPLPLPAPK